MGDARMKELPVDLLRRNPDQPRRHFDAVELRKLAASIQTTGGVIQPVVVTRRKDGWQIIAGERRWRACQLASMDTVLCRIIDDIDERQIAQFALLENLDRVELAPTEIGHAYAQLAQRHGMRQAEIARWVGRDRTEINRYIALTRLPPAIQESIDRGELSLGHAKVLLGAAEWERPRLAANCVKHEWSVRRLERELKRAATREAQSGREGGGGQELAQALGERVGAAGSVRSRGQGAWTLRLESYAPDALVGTLRRLADEIEARGKASGPMAVELTGALDVFDFLGE